MKLYINAFRSALLFLVAIAVFLPPFLVAHQANQFYLVDETHRFLAVMVVGSICWLISLVCFLTSLRFILLPYVIIEDSHLEVYGLLMFWRYSSADLALEVVHVGRFFVTMRDAKGISISVVKSFLQDRGIEIKVGAVPSLSN